MTQQSEQQTIWMTQDGFDKLKSELESLKGPVRQEIVERIANARDEGDLKENAGYHAAREEQSHLEGRIRQLEDKLRRAEIGETPKNDGVVEPGMVVTIRFDDGDEDKFLLGARDLEDGGDLDVYSPESPMGQAILGASKGDTVAYEAPNGATLELVIVEATPYQAG